MWKWAGTHSVLWNSRLTAMVESINAPMPPIAQPSTPENRSAGAKLHCIGER